MLTIDCVDPSELAKFWVAALDLEVAFDYDGQFMMLSSKQEGQPAIALQRVDEPRQGKNRMHPDFGVDDLQAEVRRLVELGATEHETNTSPDGEFTWTVLTDPEGNVFCVANH